MDADAERMLKLREMGLSVYQARIYLALLRLGQTEAREVSRLSRVPIAKVYSVLDTLQSKGLVIAEPTTPKRFSPVPLGEYLASLRAQRLLEARELEETERALGDLFRVEPAPQASDKGRVRTLKGRIINLQQAEAMLAAARSDVLFVPSTGFFARFKREWPAFEQAAQRGVRVRVLADLARVAPEHLALMRESVQARHRSDLNDAPEPACLLIADGGCAMIVHYVPDDGGTLRGEDVGLLVAEQALVQTIQRHAESHWNASEAQPRPLPADGHVLLAQPRTGGKDA